MRRTHWFGATLITAMLAFGSLSPIHAEDGDAEHGVARISFINGNASVRRGDSGEWVAAGVNAPLMSQDAIATAEGSRAEVQFDYANFVRLGANTELRMAELAGRRCQLQLARGTVLFRVLRNSDADVEIDTPSISVRPHNRGIYRISVLENGESEITVRAGEVEIFTPRGAESLHAGRTMLVRGDPSNPEFQTIAALPEDEWDRWNQRRDSELERSSSYRYVSHDIYGAESLDPYGRWVSTPDYGYVWAPTVDADWAPYRNGRWVWSDWYGWTWVSYDPWGWAPYHYGRWFHRAGFGWCWYPGSIYGRHYWSPAYVGFFGFGGVGFGFGFGFGNVGWVPLAPYETFYPWWGRGFYGGYRGGFVNRTTIVNNINVVNTYRNARVGGYTAVNAGDFARGNFNRNFVHASAGDLQRAGMVRGQMGIAPTNSSLQFTNRSATFVPRGGADPNQRFFTRRQPAPVERIPFAQQQRALGGQATTAFRGTDTTPRITGGAAPVQRGGSPAADGGRTWSRFGGPGGNTGTGAQPNAPVGRGAPAGAVVQQPGGVNRGAPSSPDAGRGGWRRFGEPGRPGSGGSDRPPEARGRSNAGEGNLQRQGSAPSTAPPARTSPRSDAGRGWQRFGEPGGNGAPPAAQQPRSAPGGNRFEPPSREAGGRYNRGDSGQRSLQVSPPMVHERSAPQAARPSYSAPSYAPPSGGGYSRGGGYNGGSAAPSGGYARGGGGYNGGSAAPSGGYARGGGGAAGGGGGGGGRQGGGGGGGNGGGHHGGRR